MVMSCKKQSRAAPRQARWRGALLLAALLAGCGPNAPHGLRSGPEFKVVAVQEEGGLKLENGGVARLAALDFPKGSADAVNILKRDALGRSGRVYFDGAERDAHGATLGHIYARSEAGAWIWLQRNLVAAGAARVAPQASDRNGAVALLSVEQAARSAKKGLWADPSFSVRAPDPADLSKDIGGFVLVEGAITSTGRAAHRVFLNFGADYMTDFTVTVPEDAWSAWPGGAPFLLNLKGEKVRVRGVLSERNGPSIEAVTPAQIEVLTLP